MFGGILLVQYVYVRTKGFYAIGGCEFSLTLNRTREILENIGYFEAKTIVIMLCSGIGVCEIFNVGIMAKMMNNRAEQHFSCIAYCYKLCN
jgi:hypothetical protein